MGCWNGTDGFGGVPIKAGRKIKAVIIQNNSYKTDASGFCGINGYATPISFTLEGTYNDYGGIDLNSEKDRSVVLLRELLEKELNDGTIRVGSYYSEESKITTIEGMSLESFINDYIARDSVYRKYTDYDNKIHYTNIGLMMFSDEIFNSVSKAILADNTYENKDVTEESLRSDTIWYLEDTMESPVLSDSDKRLIEIYSRDLEKAETEEDKAELLEYIEELKSAEPRFGSVWKNSKARQHNKSYNILVMLSSYDSVNTKVFTEYYHLIKNNYRKYDKMVYSKMLSDFILLLKCMNSLRKAWQGMPGSGSQWYDSAAFIGLSEGIQRQLEKDNEELMEYTIHCEETWNTFQEDEEYKIVKTTYKTLTVEDSNEDLVTITMDEYNKYFGY